MAAADAQRILPEGEEKILCERCGAALNSRMRDLLQPKALTMYFAPEVANDAALLEAALKAQPFIMTQQCKCCPAYVRVELSNDPGEVRIVQEATHHDPARVWIWSTLSGLVERRRNKN